MHACNLKVGDTAITTCRIDNMLSYVERCTHVKIIKASYGWYDIQTQNGDEFLFVDGDCLEKLS